LAATPLEKITNRSWLFAYIATFLASVAGPATLTVLWASDVAWRAATSGLWSLVAQVLPVLLLAIAVERHAFAKERRPAYGSLAAFIFVVVVGSAAIAELLALLLLAFPCTTNDCATNWPTALADTATFFMSAAIPGALTLLVLSGAIQSGLPFGGGITSFQRVATFLFAGAIALPLGSLGVAALATGRILAGVLAFLLSAALGSKARVTEQFDDGHEHIDLDLFGHTVLEVGDEGSGFDEAVEGRRNGNTPRSAD
jgi:hypothetical protein